MSATGLQAFLSITQVDSRHEVRSLDVFFFIHQQISRRDVVATVHLDSLVKPQNVIATTTDPENISPIIPTCSTFQLNFIFVNNLKSMAVRLSLKIFGHGPLADSDRARYWKMCIIKA